jgi:hypothetical protein
VTPQGRFVFLDKRTSAPLMKSEGVLVSLRAVSAGHQGTQRFFTGALWPASLHFSAVSAMVHWGLPQADWFWSSVIAFPVRFAIFMQPFDPQCGFQRAVAIKQTKATLP